MNLADKKTAAKDTSLESIGAGAMAFAAIAASAGNIEVSVACIFVGVICFAVKYITRK
jgi:hypothetical protein